LVSFAGVVYHYKRAAEHGRIPIELVVDVGQVRVAVFVCVFRIETITPRPQFTHGATDVLRVLVGHPEAAKFRVRLAIQRDRHVHAPSL
jgi:hypothetical protein